MKIAVIVGSTREGRFSERPARWLAARLRRNHQLSVDVLDLREFPLPFYASKAAPARSPRVYESPEIERWGKAVDAADGFVMVTPEYNHGYSAVIKNALDHLFVEWNHKPASFVSYGNAGGARAVEQLRLVTIELEMAPLRHALHVPAAAMMAARTNPGISDDELFKDAGAAADRLEADLLWWTRALSAARKAG